MSYKLDYFQKTAVYFNGAANNYAYYAPSGSGIANLCPQPNEAFSVALWINKTSIVGNTWVGQFAKASPHGGWTFHSEASDKISMHMNSIVSGSARTLYAHSEAGLPETLNRLGDWFHLCATYNGTGETTGIKVYVNAQDMTVATSLSSGTAAEFAGGSMPTSYFNVAALADSGGSFWSHNTLSHMCQIGIWDAALTATQVQEVYNGTNDFPGPCDLTTLSTGADLVGYWLNNDPNDTSSTLQDGSGNNYDLTVNSGLLEPVRI